MLFLRCISPPTLPSHTIELSGCSSRTQPATPQKCKPRTSVVTQAVQVDLLQRRLNLHRRLRSFGMQPMKRNSPKHGLLYQMQNSHQQKRYHLARQHDHCSKSWFQQASTNPNSSQLKQQLVFSGAGEQRKVRYSFNLEG